MRGVKSDDLLAIVDFLYCGEANVYQENLDSFLAIVSELQLKGLMAKADTEEVIKEEPFKITQTALKKVKQTHKKVSNVLNPVAKFDEQIASNVLDTVGGEGALNNGDLQEIDQKCISMMEATTRRSVRGQLLYRCKVCGKEEINGGMKSHIESNHLEGIFIPCNFCEKTFRSRNSLSKHINDKHTQR